VGILTSLRGVLSHVFSAGKASRQLASAGVLLVVAIGAGVALVPAWAQNEQVIGQVIDDDTGAPVQDAQLRVMDGVEPQSAPLASTRSAASGEFAVARPTSATSILVAKAPGYATHRVSFVRLAGRPVVRLRREGTIAGSVRDCDTGAPLRAAVTVVSRTPDNIVNHGARTQSGAFVLRDLFPGPSVLVARSTGHAPATAVLDVPGGKVLRLDGPCLRKGATVVGGVTDDRARPVTGARVSVEYKQRLVEAGLLEEFVGGRLMTDATGHFAARDIVPEVPFMVTVAKGNRSTTVGPLVLAPGAEHSVGSVVVR
jgi:hypothetical protein